MFASSKSRVDEPAAIADISKTDFEIHVADIESIESTQLVE